MGWATLLSDAIFSFIIGYGMTDQQRQLTRILRIALRDEMIFWRIYCFLPTSYVRSDGKRLASLAVTFQYPSNRYPIDIH